jgi:hypothetical protein
MQKFSGDFYWNRTSPLQFFIQPTREYRWKIHQTPLQPIRWLDSVDDARFGPGWGRI